MLKSNKKQNQSRRVDLFAESDAAEDLRREGIERTVRELAKQYREVEDAYREFIQNAIDSGTNQIDVYFTEDPVDEEHTRLSVSIEDYGCGMTKGERDDFFLKLFRSSKELDDETIGKYGIGICSVLALEPESIYVESSKDTDSWSFLINQVIENPKTIYGDIDERKGTLLSITKTHSNEDIEDYKRKVRDKISFYCARSKTPIYVGDELINKPFDLDTRVKVSGCTSDTEFVMGIGAPEEGYELLNTRLKLEEGDESLIGDGISCIVSSNRFTHTMSRDHVERNEAYSSVLHQLSGKKDKLFLKALETIQEYENEQEPKKPSYPSRVIHLNDGKVKTLDSERKLKNVEKLIDQEKEKEQSDYFEGGIEEAQRIVDEFKEEREQYDARISEIKEYEKRKSRELNASWKFVSNYITQIHDRLEESRLKGGAFTRGIKSIVQPKSTLDHLMKKLPDGTGQYKIFDTLSHGKASLNDVFETIEDQGHIVGISRYDSPDLRDELVKNNFMLVNYDRNNPPSVLLNKIAPIKEAYWHYSVSPRSERELEEPEQKLMDDLKEALPGSVTRLVSDIYPSDKDKLGARSKDPFIYRAPDGKMELGKEQSGMLTRCKGYVTESFYGKNYELAINLDHPLVQQIMTINSASDSYTKETSIEMLSSWIYSSRPL